MIDTNTTRAHLGQDSGRPDQISQGIRLGGQRPSVVYHLLQELIRRAEIVLHGALVGGIAEVNYECVGDLVQEFDDQQRRRLEVPPPYARGTRGEVRQSVPEDVEEVDGSPAPGVSAAAAGRHVGDLHHGRDRIVQREGIGSHGRDSAVVVEAFRGAGPEDVAYRPRGEYGTEVTLDEDLADRGEDEQGLYHGYRVSTLLCNTQLTPTPPTRGRVIYIMRSRNNYLQFFYHNNLLITKFP